MTRPGRLYVARRDIRKQLSLGVVTRRTIGRLGSAWTIDRMEAVDCVVVGGGVVGLACARALAQAGREVLVLEAESAIGTATSARNSEVIHAGLYYAPGSLKARLCVQGRDLLYAYCAERHVDHRRCGKLVVACTPEEVPALQALQARAQANGVQDLQWLNAPAVHALEPALAAHAALLSPSTGIVDSHGLMQALWADAEAAGATLVLRTPLVDAQADVDGLVLQTGGTDPMRLRTRLLVNSAGLQACQVAACVLGPDSPHVPRPYYAKGAYFSLGSRAPFSHLIYPAPSDSGHLGVHLTLDLGGQARFGPSFRWVDEIDYSVSPDEAAGFEEAIRHYWPGLPAGSLQAAYAGVRPRISGPDAPAADFRIDGPAQHGQAGLINLLGIESPGLTAAMAIAAEVAAMAASAQGLSPT